MVSNDISKKCISSKIRGGLNMIVLDTVSIIFDAILFLITAFFMRGMKWSREEDRSSIVGFGFMMATCVLNVIAIIW